MQVVILAAGRGVRMGDLTKEIPKPMLKIGGKPILEYKINILPKEIKEVILVVAYKKEIIQNYFGDFFNGRKITYIEQDKFNGTGGALTEAKNVLNENFLVMMGDDLYAKGDIEKMLSYELAILGYQMDNPNQFGVLKVDKEGNWIDIIEKPKDLKQGLVNTGLYMLNKKFFDYLLVDLGNGEYGLPQTMLQMKDAFNIKVIETGKWFPIGNPQALEDARGVMEQFS